VRVGPGQKTTHGLAARGRSTALPMSIHAYILWCMAERAKLFKNGGSQAVRLPKDCRFPGQEEVVVRRIGRQVVLEPVDSWPAEFVACLGAWTEPIARPKSEPIQKLRDPFA
jgi:antitoxin VapB